MNDIRRRGVCLLLLKYSLMNDPPLPEWDWVVRATAGGSLCAVCKVLVGLTRPYHNRNTLSSLSFTDH